MTITDTPAVITTKNQTYVLMGGELILTYAGTEIKKVRVNGISTYRIRRNRVHEIYSKLIPLHRGYVRNRNFSKALDPIATMLRQSIDSAMKPFQSN